MPTGAPSDFAALKGLLRKPLETAPGERCDFCAKPVAPQHSHLIDLKARRIMCGCRPCALTFEPDGAARGRFKLVPERFARIDDLRARRRDVGCAANSDRARVLFSQFGRRERLRRSIPGRPVLRNRNCRSMPGKPIAERHPVLSTLRADVEAILLAAACATATDCFIVPIDAAYELVGFDPHDVARLRWRRRCQARRSTRSSQGIERRT